jgi:DNA-binding NarL/FixJ family response regulator
MTWWGMGAWGGEQGGARLAVLTADAAAGEAIAHTCRRRGLQVRVVDPDVDEDVRADVLLVDRRSEGPSKADLRPWAKDPGLRIVALGDSTPSAATVRYDAQVGLDEGLDQLLRAIATTERTRQVLPTVSSAETEELSVRERQVVALLLAGLDGGSIAAQLSITENTVRSHLQNIASKLGVRGRAEVAARALKMGFVPGEVDPGVRA